MLIEELRKEKELNVTVNKVIYEAERDGYYILSVVEERCREPFVVKLNSVKIDEDDMLTIVGEWKKTGQYGYQFIASAAIKRNAFSLKGIEKYLAENIYGIGKVKAAAIVKKFGHGTEDVFNNEPEKIKDLLNMKDTAFLKMIGSWIEKNTQTKYVLDLAKLGISGRTATKVVKEFGEGCVERINNNPYELIQIRGIGFKKADEIAKKLGITNDDIRRVNAGIVFVLNEQTSFGNVCCEAGNFIGIAAEALGVDRELVDKELSFLIDEKELVYEQGYVYITKLFYEERTVAKRLIDMNTVTKYPDMTDKAAQSLNVTYTDEQIEAIRLSIRNRVSILTGGPGTGKTTTVKGIIKAHKLLGHDIYCAAPTGRAAKRMSEATGEAASTIHRLLEFSGNGFMRNETNPIGVDNNKDGNNLEPWESVLIVDETSMMDISLMAVLLKAIPRTMSLVLVGDVDQLPSVGPGTVLSDIIESGKFPVTRLTKIQRQAAGSAVIRTAHAINNGFMPDLKSRDTDMFVYNITDKPAEDIQNLILRLYMSAVGRYDIMDVQVLSAQHTGQIGTDVLNEKIRELVNKDGEKIPGGMNGFRKGDKVMQIRNNYSLGVFNGDIGIIKGYDDETKKMQVAFGSAYVDYEAADTDDLVLAYACTVHKSQGSEYPVVIFPVSTQHFFMLERNLIYTAITRAKEFLIMPADAKALAMGIKKVNAKKRTSRLISRFDSYEEFVKKSGRRAV